MADSQIFGSSRVHSDHLVFMPLHLQNILNITLSLEHWVPSRAGESDEEHNYRIAKAKTRFPVANKLKAKK